MSNIIEETKAEVKANKNKAKAVKTEQQTNAVKSWFTKAYKVTSTLVCEVALATFAIIGVMSLIHTDKQLQTVLAVFFVALLLAVKFNNKK